MELYNKHQVIASFAVAIFIISTAFILMIKEDSVYRYCLDKSEDSKADTYTKLSSFEKELCYQKLSDNFESFFSGRYELAGYDICGDNITKLRQIKFIYRVAWLFSVAAVVVGVRSFYILSRRRLYMPFTYGGAMAALLTALGALITVCSRHGLLHGVKMMVLRNDYGYFEGEDVLQYIFPDGFARMKILVFVISVFILILIMNLVRMLIAFLGRPHKF